MNPSLAKKVGLAVAAAVGLLVLVSLVSYQSQADARDASQRARHSQEVLARLESILSRLLIAESEGRAFIITRQDRHWKAYQAALPTLEGDQAALRELTADNPEQQQRLDALEPLLERRLAALTQSLEVAQANRLGFRAKGELLRQGSKLRGEILALIAPLKSAEEAILVQRVAVAEASARRASWIALGSNLAALLCLTLAGAAIWRDYTALRRAEATVRDSAARYRALVEAFPDVLLRVGKDGTLLDANGLEALSLVSPPAAGGGARLSPRQGLAEVLPGEFARSLGQVIQRRVQGEAVPAVEVQGPRADGTPSDWEVRLTSSGPAEILAVLRDVSAEKQAREALRRSEERLRASEEKYRLLFEHNPLPLWLFDPDNLAFLAVNEAAVRHYGYTRAEFLAMTTREIRPPEEWPRHQAALVRLAAERPAGPQPQGIWRHRKKDGTVILVEITVDFFLLGGQRVGFVLAHDVTEQVRTLEALRRERDFAEGLIETTPAVVLVLDLEGCILRINSYLEHLTGYRRADVQGQDWFATFLPQEDQARLRTLYRQVLDTEPLQGYVNRIVTRDGRERSVQWFARHLTDAQGTVQGLLAVGHDITDLQHAQERALQAERLAAIGEMVTGLAHESRNALQRSHSCLKMLSWQVHDRPKALELIQRLQQAQEHLQHLYEGVRGYAAPLRLHPRPCHLGDLVREAWDQLAGPREGRAAQLHLETEAADWHAAVDPLAFGQVVRNILENALSACPDPVVVTVRAAAAVLAERPALRLAIRDNGPGLSPEACRRIFEPFFTTKTHGTGLGMVISQRIVEAHHGRMAVGAPDGPGTEILVTLPREVP